MSVALLGIGWGGTMSLTALSLASKGYGADVVGWMTAAMALGGVIGAFASPWTSQRFGRRMVMLGCLILACASTILIQYTDSLAIWFAMRALFGIAMAPLFVLGEAWIVSLSTDATRNRVIAGTAFFAAFDNVILSFLPLTLLDSGFDQSHALAAASLALAAIFVGVHVKSSGMTVSECR